MAKKVLKFGGTSDGTTASHINDSGTATKLTIKATF